MNKFVLGVEVRDVVTGFRGITTARAEYLTGCTQYSVVPPIREDGTLATAEWFDEQRLEEVGRGIATSSRPTGGPQREAPRAR